MPDSEAEVIGRFIVRQLMFGDDAVLQLDDPLLESGVLDSLGITDLVSFLEEEFSVSISLQHLVPQNFATIQTISKLLEECRVEARS